MNQFVAVAHADEFNLEVGGVFGLIHGEGGAVIETVPAIGAAVMLGYWWDSWAVGVTTRGLLTFPSRTLIVAEEAVLNDKLAFRRILYGPVVRKYISEDTYFQLGASVTANEALKADPALSPEYGPANDRFFLRGYTLNAGYGWELTESPFFMRVDYIFERYGSVRILETQDGLNRLVAKRQLSGSLRSHGVLLTVGWGGIF